MLEREVEVGVARGHDGVDECWREPRGVEVEQAHTIGEPSDLVDQTHQGLDGRLLAQVKDLERFGIVLRPPVEAPGRKILGDEHDLARPSLDELLDLPQDRGSRARALVAPEARDCAEAAAPVAALRHLDVGDGAGRQRPRQLEQAGFGAAVRPGSQCDPRRRGSEERGAEAGNEVDLRQGVGQLLSVALGHAAGHDEAGTAGLELTEGEHDIDRLLTSGLDEGAGVDDHELSFRGIVSLDVALGRQLPGQLL